MAVKVAKALEAINILFIKAPSKATVVFEGASLCHYYLLPIENPNLASPFFTSG